MAFKKPKSPVPVPESPDRLFIDLPRRKYPSLYDHQGQILRNYAERALNVPDVALQLPTGSGKTLVGLLLAEWRRRKFGERVVYLCPTRQLVNQVASEASEKYGLSVEPFTGKIRNYSPEAKAAYKGADRVAITTYNSLFNVNPFFDDAEIVILDDAHAAENYVASHWTVRLSGHADEDKAVFNAVAGVLRKVVPSRTYARLSRDAESIDDAAWVDKIPTHKLAEIADELREVVSGYLTEHEQRFPWAVLSDNLLACQMYVGSSEVLIRPLIPPTSTHAPFSDATQRIYMSATLGAGGDLERLTGRRSIVRLEIPKGWDQQGIGRRFFMFPEKSLDDTQVDDLRLAMMERAGRSLVLAPSNQRAEKVGEDVKALLKYPVFFAHELESGKHDFISKDRAVAVIANRYDGIDLPNDECRLLFVEGLPRATHLQERFLMTRMGCNLLFNERVQTRVIQAVGRCTRGLNDYAAVVITGSELAGYLSDRKRRAYLHPELQAELEFGIEQSTEVDRQTILDNLEIFLAHDAEWESANEEILSARARVRQERLPAMDQLGEVVQHEISWQEAMWNHDFEAAFEKAREVLAGLTDERLRGYRALWHYLAGSAAELASSSDPRLATQARQEFTAAKAAAAGIPWLVALAKGEGAALTSGSQEYPETLMLQVERLEAQLVKLGTLHNRAFTAQERKIREGLSASKGFERAQVLLGEHLGFIADKCETDASPDPWWFIGDVAIVFEDHAGADPLTATIDATKARQASSHPDWMRANVPDVKDARIQSVLVTPAKKAKLGALPHLGRVSYWELDEFRSWAERALNTIRELRTTFVEPGDLEWRAEAARVLIAAKADAPGLAGMLANRRASECLEGVP